MKVAILGTVPETRLLAPYDDKSCEIWVCSPGNRGGIIPRVTRWFELHGIVDLKGQENAEWAPHYFAWLREQSFPIYMQEPNDLVPGSITFPHKRLLKRFGRKGRLAFTSSIAWMIAFAVDEGAEEIGIFGVNMAASEEAYSLQKAGCHMMIELARDAGVSVHVPLESCLGALPPLYGYAEASNMGRRLAIEELKLNQAIAQFDQQMAALAQQKAQALGSLETIRYMRRTWVDGEFDAILDDEDETQSIAEGQRRVEFPDQRPVVVPDLSARSKPETMPVERTEGGVLVPVGGRKANSRHAGQAAEA